MQPLEVTCALIIENGKVLATQRSAEMPHPFKWEFPGGKVKEGESPETCVEREIKEELGLKMHVEKLLAPVVHYYETHSVKLIPCMGSREEGVIVLAEHCEYHWFSCDELDQVDWLAADVEIARMVKEILCQ